MWPAHATPGTGKGVVHEQESQVMHVAFFFDKTLGAEIIPPLASLLNGNRFSTFQPYLKAGQVDYACQSLTSGN